MFIRKLFSAQQVTTNNCTDQEVPPSVHAINIYAQPQPERNSGMRRSAAATDLLALEENLEILDVQTANSTVTMVRSFKAVVATTVTTAKPQVQFGSCVYKAKGYEMEDTACSLYQSRPTSFFDVDGSSSSDYEHHPEHSVISKKQIIRSQSNTPDPDRLDDIWLGRVSPK